MSPLTHPLPPLKRGERGEKGVCSPPPFFPPSRGRGFWLLLSQRSRARPIAVLKLVYNNPPEECGMLNSAFGVSLSRIPYSAFIIPHLALTLLLAGRQLNG